MALDVKPEGELFSHQYSAQFKKGENHDEEFARRLAEFMVAFCECYPHYIEKIPFKEDKENWVFKFWIEQK